MKKVGIVLLLACMLGLPVFAQTVPDFQLIMNTLQSKLDAVSTNAWTASAYSFVVGTSGYTPPFNQTNPTFPGRNNTEDNIKDDDLLALLQKVLENDACVRELLGGTFVDNVRAQFFANQALIQTRETYFTVKLNDSTRISLNYVISANNRPAWTDPATLYTGLDAKNIHLCVDSGILIVGTTCLDQAVDIPSLWGEDGLLNSAPGAAGLGEDLRDLLAAYLTIGQQGGVDYVQALIFQTFYRGVLPNIMQLVLSLIGKAETELDIQAWLPDLDFDTVNKEYDTSVSNVTISQTFSPALRICLSGDPPCSSQYVDILYVNATVSNIKQGILDHWLNWYNIGSNGFGTGFATRLAATGDLNLDGKSNYTAYVEAGMNRANWFVLAGAGVQFYWTSDLIQPAAPIDYGAQAFFKAEASGIAGPTYKWYSGPTPATLTEVVGATGTTYNPVINFYSSPGNTQVRYYKAVATASACSSTIDLNSTTVAVTGGAPPAITFYEPFVQDQSGQYQPGQNASLSCPAGVSVGTLTYQWQKWEDAFAAWVDIPGATSSLLEFKPISGANAGDYHCVVTNTIAGKEDKANVPYSDTSNAATLDVAPDIIIDPQPVGADLNIGGNHTMSCGATVESGVLSYRWQFNPGTGYVNLTSWVDSGTNSFTTTWNIAGAQISDSGTYRVQVQNTLAPFGTYLKNSATAAVNVSSGAVYYVDPTGNNTTGKSWVNAFWSLQDAIDAANADAGGNGGEVWVAGGPEGTPIVYNEMRTVLWGGSVGDPGRQAGSLIMKSNVGLYGGFEGYRGGAGRQETSRLQRNRAKNVCVIDGSTSRGGLPAYHVVVFGARLAATVNAVVDGFVIQGGHAAGITADYHTWRGGGIYNYGSAPTIANCIIRDNRAQVSGGGIANEIAPFGPGDAQIVNCVIHTNHANRQADGGAGPGGGNPIRGGGGIFNNQSSSTVNMDTIFGNTIDTTYVGDPLHHGELSGGIYTWNATPTVSNTIIWANTGGIRHEKPATAPPVQDTTATYSDIQMTAGTYPGTGNISINPALTNNTYEGLVGPTFSDFVPNVGSPVLNVADPSISGGDDLLGVPRPINTVADMGAFELSTVGPAPACLPTTVDLAVTPDTSTIDPFSVFDAENSLFEAPLWKLSITPKTFSCADIPTTTIQVVASDILGRTGSCNATTTVFESVPPVAVCNNITVELDGTGNYALTPADIAALSAGSSDNCTPAGSLIISAVPAAFTCANVGLPQNVTITVEDASGNEASCTAQVTVNDSVPPVPPASPAAISVDLLPNGTRQLNLTELESLAAGTTDNCAVDLPATTASPASFTCANIGTNSIAITVYDINGNSAVGSADVTVNDVTPPVFTGISPRTHVIVNGIYTEAAAKTGVTADDVCSGDVTASIVVTAVDEGDAPVAFPIDPNDRGDGQPWVIAPDIDYVFDMTYTVQDGSGNVKTETTTLTFFALQLPEITILGENPVTIACPGPYSDAGATAYDPESASDITASMSTIVAVNAGVPGDSYTVTYSVPVPGYPSMPPVTAVRDVIVEDTTAPVITLVAENPLYWSRGDVFPNDASIRTATDECDGDLTAAIVTTGAVDANTLGTYNLAFDVVDGEGNPADTVGLTVIVVDLLEIITQPVGARLYTTDDPYEMTAAWRNGVNVSGYEWYQDAVGLGFVADPTTPNTVTLSVDPAALGAGTYQYYLAVSDESGDTETEDATIEVGAPLSSTPLTDLLLQEAETSTWSITVTGGLGAVNYQWYALRTGETTWVPVVDGGFGAGAYDGATTASLKFQPFTADMVGQYRVEVSDDYTSIIVGPANLTTGKPIPVAGVFGMAVLALATALGGASALRKRK